MDRKYSDPNIWDNSIDWDDEADGSEGGYSKGCTYIIPPAMMELVFLRAELAELRKPDCRTCLHYYELEQDCFLLRRGKHCINASEYEINNRTLRLYEKEGKV